jgi:hypothetical protein
MKFGHLIRAAVIVVAAFLLVASASASTIDFTTDVTITYVTGFVSGGTISGDKLTLSDSSSTGGATATLRFAGQNAVGVGTPTYTGLGDFIITCTSCSTSAQNTAGATFSNFVFDMYIYDSTDSAYGEFIGQSGGGTVFNNQSSISITWTPAQLGPGTSNALGGTNFGTTYFVTPGTTPIVAPNTGGIGDTSVQGAIRSTTDTTTPEPATMALAGGLLIGLAALARKRRA